MAPVKPAKIAGASNHASSSKAKATGNRKSWHKGQKDAQGGDMNALPGVQKIKASLRQTRRLLSKDTLAADVRVNTERRLKALEAQLAEAERSRKERAIAQRYHRVKFFERQKVTRKIKQTKRQLEGDIKKKERKRLEQSLMELRIDLNYILHYPKLQKYISLFPPEVRQRKSEEDDDEGDVSDAEPEGTADGPSDAVTDEERQKIRQTIRERMEKGELSGEPEAEDRAPRDQRRTRPAPSHADQAKESRTSKQVTAVKDDEFFGDESDEDGGEMDDS